MSPTLPVLDPLLHQPVRTQLVAFLSARGEATFSDLKRVLETTDGNLGAHLNKLVEAGYVEAREQAGAVRGKTVFCLTRSGRSALAKYVAALSSLMGTDMEKRPSPAVPASGNALPRKS